MELYKVNARGSFESISEMLVTALKRAGFDVVGKHVVQRGDSELNPRYEVIAVDLPRVSTQMASLSAPDGGILPACISLIETYPGEVNIAIANPSEYYVKENSQLLYLAKEISATLQTVVQGFAHDKSITPDLVTSWG